MCVRDRLGRTESHNSLKRTSDFLKVLIMLAAKLLARGLPRALKIHAVTGEVSLALVLHLKCGLWGKVGVERDPWAHCPRQRALSGLLGMGLPLTGLQFDCFVLSLWTGEWGWARFRLFQVCNLHSCTPSRGSRPSEPSRFLSQPHHSKGRCLDTVPRTEVQ